MRGLVVVTILLLAPAAHAGPFEQAEAARATGDCAAAIPLYRAFLDSVAGQPDDARSRAARQALGRCRARADILDGSVQAATSSRSRKPLGWTLVGVGSVLTLAGSLTFGYYRALVVDYNTAPEYHTKLALWPEVDNAYRMQKVGMAFALVGLGLTGFGVHRLWTVEPAQSGRGVQVGLGGRC